MASILVINSSVSLGSNGNPEAYGATLIVQEDGAPVKAKFVETESMVYAGVGITEYGNIFWNKASAVAYDESFILGVYVYDESGDKTYMNCETSIATILANEVGSLSEEVIPFVPPATGGPKAYAFNVSESDLASAATEGADITDAIAEGSPPITNLLLNPFNSVIVLYLYSGSTLVLNLSGALENSFNYATTNIDGNVAYSFNVNVASDGTVILTMQSTQEEH